MSKNKLKVVSDCYTCNDAEYYEIGVVNMMAYETPIVEVKDLTVFNERKAINSDYIGELKIEGLLNEYVVQTVDNEYYLHKNFNKEEYSSGSVYMDYRNTMDDQNLILYGHYVYKDESKIFGPLHLLKEKETRKIVQIDGKI